MFDVRCQNRCSDRKCQACFSTCHHPPAVTLRKAFQLDPRVCYKVSEVVGPSHIYRSCSTARCHSTLWLTTSSEQLPVSHPTSPMQTSIDTSLSFSHQRRKRRRNHGLSLVYLPSLVMVEIRMSTSSPLLPGGADVPVDLIRDYRDRIRGSWLV